MFPNTRNQTLRLRVRTDLISWLKFRLLFINFGKQTGTVGWAEGWVKVPWCALRFVFLASNSLHNLRGQMLLCQCYPTRHLQQIHWSTLLCGMCGFPANSSVATLNICHILMRYQLLYICVKMINPYEDFYSLFRFHSLEKIRQVQIHSFFSRVTLYKGLIY